MANQTVQLSSILSNYDHVLEATATAYDSAGSAARENIAAVDSLEGRTKQLQAAFQDLSRDIVDGDLIKNILGLGTATLELADTDIGQLIIKIGLLTGALGGIGSLASAAGIMNIAKQFYTFGQMLNGAALAAVGLSNVIFPLAAIISGVAVGAYELYKVWKENNPTLEETIEQIDLLNGQLQTNQDRLNEINQLQWYQKTPEIIAERDALIAENDELQKNIDKLQERQAAITEAGAHTFVFSGPNGEDITVYAQTAEQAYLTLAADLEIVGRNYDDIKYKVDALGYSMQSQEAETNNLISEAQNYINILNTEHSLTNEQIQDFNTVNQAIQAEAAEYQNLENQGYTLTEQQKQVIATANELSTAFDEARSFSERYADSIHLTEEQYNNLIAVSPSMASALQDVGNGYYNVSVSAADAANGLITADGRILASNKNMVDNAINNLITLMESYREVYRSLMGDYGDLNPAYLQLTPEQLAAKKAYESTYSAIARLRAAQTKSGIEGYVGAPVITGGGDGGSGGRTTSTQKKTQENQEEIIQNTETLNNLHEEENNLLREQQTELENQQKAYQALFKMGADVAQSHIDQLQKELDLLEKENKAQEDAFKLQQLEENLAKAKSQKVRVYKDGRFQYISDPDAVSSAQQALNEYKQQQALETEKKRIDEEIKYWQEWQNQWSNAVNNYGEQQDELLAKEKFGIDKESENWDTRITNLQDFVDEYASIVSKLNNLEFSAGESMEVAGGYPSVPAGAGYNFSGGGGPSKSAYEEVLSGSVSQSQISSGYYNPNVDYSLAIKEAQSSGASASFIQNLQEQRQNKIDAQYGGVDPSKKYSSGTFGARGGLSLVGENGPEMRILNSGDGILPANITENLWKWGSVAPSGLINTLSNLFSQRNNNTNQNINIEHISLPNVTDGQSFVDFMRNNFWRSAVQYSTT